MKHPVILDACTIINLLRIDEDEFLFKLLMSLDLSIASTVYEEVKINIKRNKLSEEQEKYIEQLIPSFLVFSRGDADIVKDLSQEYFDKLCSFARHNKKLNGELLSSALSLCVSREKESKVYFYTDDYPAKEQFTSLFCYQQIGVIGDSVDLLLFLYWAKPNFEVKRLKRILQDLRSEYNTPLKQLTSAIQKKRDATSGKIKTDRSLAENIDKIIKGYCRCDRQLIIDGLSFFSGNNKYPEIKSIIKQFPNIDKECVLSMKVESVINALPRCGIFKIA